MLWSCQKDQPRYDHFCKLTGDICSDNCLCQAHAKEAKQHRSDPEYVPVWKRNSLETTQSQECSVEVSCMYPTCAATVRAVGRDLRGSQKYPACAAWSRGIAA